MSAPTAFADSDLLKLPKKSRRLNPQVCRGMVKFNVNVYIYLFAIYFKDLANSFEQNSTEIALQPTKHSTHGQHQRRIIN